MAVGTSKYRYVACDPDKCNGCQFCEYICSYVKHEEFNSYRSCIRTVRRDYIMTAVTCRTCEDAPCVIACPRDALTQDPITGIIRVNDKCDGCGWCIEACDFGAILINPDTKLVEICDMCENLEEGPQCIKWCPKEALFLTTPDQVAQRSRHKILESLPQT